MAAHRSPLRNIEQVVDSHVPAPAVTVSLRLRPSGAVEGRALLIYAHALQYILRHAQMMPYSVTDVPLCCD